MYPRKRSREAMNRQLKHVQSVTRELASSCKHNSSLTLVGNFLVCKCGKKFIYRLKD